MASAPHTRHISSAPRPLLSEYHPKGSQFANHGTPPGRLANGLGVGEACRAKYNARIRVLRLHFWSRVTHEADNQIQDEAPVGHRTRHRTCETQALCGSKLVHASIRRGRECDTRRRIQRPIPPPLIEGFVATNRHRSDVRVSAYWRLMMSSRGTTISSPATIHQPVQQHSPATAGARVPTARSPSPATNLLHCRRHAARCDAPHRAAR